MFIGRQKEIESLVNELSSNKKSAILIYGKRRVGKSTLIKEATKSFDGIIINYSCVISTFEGNLNLLSKSVSNELSLPQMQFDSLLSLIRYLQTLEKRILLIIDEYPYLKQSKKKNEVDSYMQTAIDNFPSNVKLILCGSYIATMKELLYEDNPLFGRFSLVLHLRDFDYYEASYFYPSLSIRDKIAFYSVFGGCPYVLENIDEKKTLKENIISLFLPETGIVRSYIENVALKEIQKAFDTRILETLGNGKKKYTEIQKAIGGSETGLLDKQLKTLLTMETIKKTEPINSKGDKKKQFYEIMDNLMRFYFAFIYGWTGNIMRIGEEQFFDSKISSALNQFVSRRLKGIALQYFHRMAINGQYENIEDFGSYWYDDPIAKRNGEFDCVIKRTGGLFDFYECKYFTRPLTLEECDKEAAEIRSIPTIKASKIGFISVSGFGFASDNNFVLIDGEELYQEIKKP